MGRRSSGGSMFLYRHSSFQPIASNAATSTLLFNPKLRHFAARIVAIEERLLTQGVFLRRIKQIVLEFPNSGINR